MFDWGIERRHEQGYANRPEIWAILEPHAEKYDRMMQAQRPDWYESGWSGGMRSFDGLTVEELERLIEYMPEDFKGETQNESPTVAEMLEIGRRFPGTTFHGYVVSPERPDERISLEGFHLAASELDSLRLNEELGPDEHGQEEDGRWWFWWD